MCLCKPFLIFKKRNDPLLNYNIKDRYAQYIYDIEGIHSSRMGENQWVVPEIILSNGLVYYHTSKSLEVAYSVFFVSVSFVQHPPVSRSYSASFPSRRAPAGTPIIIPTPVITNPALTPAQLQEREKRPQPPSPGLATGIDTRGAKRRLIRTASAPQVKE